MPNNDRKHYTPRFEHGDQAMILESHPNNCPKMNKINRNHKLVEAGLCGLPVTEPCRSGHGNNGAGRYLVRCDSHGLVYYNILNQEK